MPGMGTQLNANKVTVLSKHECSDDSAFTENDDGDLHKFC